MTGSTVINGKTITWRWDVTGSSLIFSDGKIIPITSVMGFVDFAKAYAGASSPITTSPVTSSPILIGNAELSVLSNVSNKSYILKPGIYSTRCDWSNLTNVTIDGQNSVTFSTGNRAIQMNGNVNGVTIKNVAFKDIPNDYVIDYWNSQLVKYTGAAGSFIDGLTIDNVQLTNCGTFVHVGGSVSNAVHYGVIKNFKLSNMTFKDSPEPNSVINLGNAMGYDISKCIVNNINYTSRTPGWPNGLHNGIFQLCGWGSAYNNKITNHQGEAFRCWLFSQEGLQTVNIYNNIIWNSKKYGAIEIQNEPSYSTALPANASIRNNTAGHLNTSLDWEGQLVDLYPIPGKVELLNNVGFEMNYQSVDGKPAVPGGRTFMVNSEAGDITKLSNFTQSGNKYYSTQALAVLDTSSFKPIASGIGALI